MRFMDLDLEDQVVPDGSYAFVDSGGFLNMLERKSVLLMMPASTHQMQKIIEVLYIRKK